jgi:hypothetical protein
VSNIQDCEQNQTYIRNEEVAGVPWPVARISKATISLETWNNLHEACEALGEDNDDVEDDPIPAEPRLQRSLIRKRTSRCTACAKSSHKANMRDPNTGPSDEPSNGRDIQKPRSVSVQTTPWLGGLTIQRLDLRCSTHS